MIHGTPEEFIIKLKKLIKIVEKHQTMMEGEVTPAQIRIIFPIVKTGNGHTMQELAELAGVDKALVSRAIADLESKELVERDKKADSSERNYKIILSEKGQKFVTEKKQQHEKHFEKWRGKFTKEEMLIFKKVLDKLVEE